MNSKKEVLKSLIGKKVNFSYDNGGHNGIYYPARDTSPYYTIIDVGEDIITVKSPEVYRSFLTDAFKEEGMATVFVSIDHINFILFYDN